ncbi:MAG TPA: hypothetical protein VNZ22_14360, partial [Bacillota bacterium]|nr:hypothetical protein [Bacillota bacterium]
MNIIKTLLARLTLIGVACLACQTQATSTNVDQNTFHLQLRTAMHGIGGAVGPQGWTASLYGRRGPLMNQALQLGCRGLATNQVYHLMASVGTNGELLHLADFMPNSAGAVLMQYLAGPMQHFAGTNNPGQAWGMMGGWTNHMSWVVFPESGTNWCYSMSGQVAEPRALSMMGGTTGTGAMANPVQPSGAAGQGTLGQDSASAGMMGGGFGMGGMGTMGGSGWPAMSNWWSGMSSWWSTMA